MLDLVFVNQFDLSFIYMLIEWLYKILDLLDILFILVFLIVLCCLKMVSVCIIIISVITWYIKQNVSYHAVIPS